MENLKNLKTLEACNESMGFEPIGHNIPLKDFFKYEQCECGYAPNNKINKQILRLMKKNQRSCGITEDLASIEENIEKEKECFVRYSLCNHITFPPVTIMSNCDETSDLYYNTETGIPKMHWALVIEINHLLKHPNGKIGFGGFNMYGNEIHVYFDIEPNETPITFSWNDLKDGNTMVILYADQKKFPNGDSLIVESNLDSCFILKESLEMVKHEAHMLLLDNDLMAQNEPPCCFSCGYSNPSQVQTRCANCKLAKYCSKECQSYSWKESHKRLCEQNETLLRIAALSLLPFEDFFTFKNDEKMTLPPFRQSKLKKISKTSSMGINGKENENKENCGVQDLSQMLEKKCGIFEQRVSKGFNLSEKN